MRWADAVPDAEVADWCALARLVLGREISVQAPPNLSPEAFGELLGAGVSDWGGVSPVTVDFINPEAPWPALRELRSRTEAHGGRLVERLPVYPKHVRQPSFFDAAVYRAVRSAATDDGHARPRMSLEAA
jgi:FO synthase